MPLRDVDELSAWIERDSPSPVAQRAARAFLAELGDRPWLPPSVPIAELSQQPEYEVRSATISVEGERDITIWWLHVYATGVVDLIAVTNR